MFRPSCADRWWRDAARLRFFGTATPWSTVLLTPSTRMFDILAERRMRDAAGWLAHVRDGATLVAQVPQSLAVMDAVAAQEPGTRLVFVGLCGGLSDRRVGEVVAVSESWALNGERYRAALLPVELPTATNVQAASLLAAQACHAELVGRAQTVDLEVGGVLGQARASGVRAGALLVVSDLNRDPGVFDSDLDAIDSALHRACVTALSVADWPLR